MRKLEEALDYSFTNQQLLEEALTHPSYAHENGKPSYERLEFLGDSVLSLLINQKLFQLSPPLTAGQMSKIRSYLVSRSTLSSIANSIDLGKEIYLGRGEESSGGQKRSSILASALEALVGAIFLDGGLGKAEEVISKLFYQEWQKITQGQFPRDYKSELQEFLLSQGIYPEYCFSSVGPDHSKKFIASVFANGKLLGRGEGRSKKAAATQAARQALQSFTQNS